ncbi:hypothetical protein NLJ89_g6225 [Agrocybe chaxingu]|uniref:PLC-like phosphodiesterase n=1 Tax=Agrocybe chaxingu TaxID=84603 RepID=A0A9W8JYP7_9AGAR|nr:hypothetical protein NLJ89_g6225 [Agrocybe chaxingu]
MAPQVPSDGRSMCFRYNTQERGEKKAGGDPTSDFQLEGRIEQLQRHALLAPTSVCPLTFSCIVHEWALSAAEKSNDLQWSGRALQQTPPGTCPSNPYLSTAVARNQAVDIPTQLSLGARTLQGQAHVENGQLRFCHTSCVRVIQLKFNNEKLNYLLQALFDGGLVEDYLRKVKTFLDANPYEVFTFIFTNPDGASVQNVWKPAFDAAGITPLAYVPPSRRMRRSDWPTLGQLIDANKRVIVFLDGGAAISGQTVDFILPQFEMIWEDPFSPTSSNFPCSIDRTSGPLPNDDHMHLINHNLNAVIFGSVLIADFANAQRTNSLDSILAHANGCAPLSQGRAPNFVLLDFIDVGATKQAVDRLNGF